MKKKILALFLSLGLGTMALTAIPLFAADTLNPHAIAMPTSYSKVQIEIFDSLEEAKKHFKDSPSVEVIKNGTVFEGILAYDSHYRIANTGRYKVLYKGTLYKAEHAYVKTNTLVKDSFEACAEEADKILYEEKKDGVLYSGTLSLQEVRGAGMPLSTGEAGKWEMVYVGIMREIKLQK